MATSFCAATSAVICIDLFRRLFPDYTPEQIDAADRRISRCVPGSRSTRTKPFIRVSQKRWRASAARKSTATTKGTPTTRIVLEQFGLIDYFDHVQGTDGFPPSPSPT